MALRIMKALSPWPVVTTMISATAAENSNANSRWKAIERVMPITISGTSSARMLSAEAANASPTVTTINVSVMASLRQFSSSLGS